MIRASDLRGLPAVDLIDAEKLGTVDEVIIDPDSRRFAALVVATDAEKKLPFRAKRKLLVPADRVYAIGPQAITLEQLEDIPDFAEVDEALPTLSSIIGKKVVSRHGKLLGSVRDVLLEEDTGHVIGYALDVPHAASGLNIFGRGKVYWPDYVRADARLRVSKTLIVAPDDALMRRDTTKQVTQNARTEPALGWFMAPSRELPSPKVLVRGHRDGGVPLLAAMAGKTEATPIADGGVQVDGALPLAGSTQVVDAEIVSEQEAHAA